MEAIILAGGMGTRLRRVVPDLPKPLAPIGDIPFLEILIKHLKRKGFKRIILSTGYMAEKISNYFGNNFYGIEISYSVENEPLGTGGAIASASKLVREDHFFVLNGDTFIELEFDILEKIWHTEHKPVIVARKLDNTERFGIIKIKGNYVHEFSNESESGPGLINGGCYVFPSNQFNELNKDIKFSLERDFLPSFVRNNKVVIHVANGIFIDIGVPDDYVLAQKLLSSINNEESTFS